ncbi:hypothetical protein BTN49_1598 [Candidatus Enterovibrio escicola]|uniref:Uncharacterized protein n=1 Tax=Candidatus Enterovibrio escicola TaxID=1927127 RepID=A0A2A5T3B5_9GAMM|nr:hypothetical protein BTN49_1598 [Candidatus Enterovibrio escacola]
MLSAWLIRNTSELSVMLAQFLTYLMHDRVEGNEDTLSM